MNVNQLLAELERRHPGEGEYLQAVREVLLSVETVYNRHPEFEKLRIAERIVEPDRIDLVVERFQTRVGVAGSDGSEDVVPASADLPA